MLDYVSLQVFETACNIGQFLAATILSLSIKSDHFIVEELQAYNIVWLKSSVYYLILSLVN